MMPRKIAPYAPLRNECASAIHFGRPASVEPADILLLLDRVTVLEAVAKAAERCLPHVDGMLGFMHRLHGRGEFVRPPLLVALSRALARLDHPSNPPRVAGKAKR